MINRESMLRLGQLWTKMKDQRFQLSPVEFMEAIAWIKQQKPVLQADFLDNIGAYKIIAPNVSVPAIREQMRETKLVFYMFLRALRHIGFVESELTYTCKTFIGISHYGLNNYESALRYLDVVLPFLRRTSVPGDDAYLGATYAWAASAQAMGRGLESLPVVEDTIAKAREAGCNSELLRKLEEFPSAVYAGLGQFGRTRRLLEKSIEESVQRFGRESRENVEAMMRLALSVELPSGDLVRATALLGEAMFIVESNRGATWAELARYLVMYLAAEITARVGDHDGEIRYLKESVQSRRKYGTKRDPTLVGATLRLAKSLCQLKRWPEALSCLTELGEDTSGIGWMIPEHKVEYAELYMTCGNALGIQVPNGQILGLVVEAQCGVVRQLLGWSGEDLLLKACRQLWNTVGLRLALLHASSSAIAIAEDFRLVLEFKGIVAESLCITREHRLAELYPALRERLEQLGELRRQLQGSYRDIFQGLPETELERAAHRLRSDKEELEEDLRRHIPEMDSVVPSTEQLADALRQLDPDSLLLDFVGIPQKFSPQDGFAVFLLPAGRPDLLKWVHLGDGKAICEAVGEFRRALLSQVDPKRFGGASAPDYQMVWDRIWAPVEHALNSLRNAHPEKMFRRLFVSLDNTLAWLPLQVLRNPAWAEGRFLIDEYEISYITTSRDIVNACGRPPGKWSRPLTMGLCDFRTNESEMATLQGGQRFPRLPNAENESREVGARLGADVWTGPQQVTKQRVLEHLGHVDATTRRSGYHSPLVVHIVTHGFSLAENERGGPVHLDEVEEIHRVRLALERSGLALSGAADSLESLCGSQPLPNGTPGILSAYEISGLDLRNTELVVVSACESGIGLISSGEGVFGLQRAFFIAGARSLVMTLWTVDHIGAGLLMDAFYARLRRGASRSAALREAQLQVRKRLRWPASWGGFICQGNPLCIPEITVSDPPVTEQPPARK